MFKAAELGTVKNKMHQQSHKECANWITIKKNLYLPLCESFSLSAFVICIFIVCLFPFEYVIFNNDFNKGKKDTHKKINSPEGVGP